jgi:SAM-dependent methyltransferase
MVDNVLSAGYNAVFAATPNSPTLRRLWLEHAAGLDFPQEFAHISFVTLQQLRRMQTELRLSQGQTLVDVGCGMSGPALWMAKETGARLIGVDFSEVAVRLAASRATDLGLSGQARFVLGTFTATGLENESAHAVMSEDALQYAPDKRVAMVEVARILRPGGRFVFTAFELESERAESLPVLGEDPVADYQTLLQEAGFVVDIYDEVPGWPEPMETTYGALLNAKETLTQEMGAMAATALFAELTITLQRRPYRRRVLVSARKS